MDRTAGLRAPDAGGKSRRKKPTLTRGEKWLLFAGLLLVALFFTIAISPSSISYPDYCSSSSSFSPP